MSLMVVDGTALLLRAWFAGADALTVSQSFLRRTSAAHRAVVFDAGLVTFRTHLDACGGKKPGEQQESGHGDARRTDAPIMNMPNTIGTSPHASERMRWKIDKRAAPSNHGIQAAGS